MPFDILPPLVPLDPALFVEIEVLGHALAIVDLLGLVRLKLRAGGVRDLYDIAILVSLNPELGKDVRRLAAGQPVELRRLLNMIEDPRTQAAAAEIRRHEAATRPPKPRAARRERKG